MMIWNTLICFYNVDKWLYALLHRFRLVFYHFEEIQLFQQDEEEREKLIIKYLRCIFVVIYGSLVDSGWGGDLRLNLNAL